MLINNEEILNYIKENNLDILPCGNLNALVLRNNGYRLVNNIRNEKLLVTIIDDKGSTVETYSAKCNNGTLVEKQKNAIDTFITISESEDYSPGEDKLDDDEELITEDEVGTSKYSSIPSGLDAVKDMITNIGDELKAISDMSGDVEVISIIMNLANNAYNLALDIDAAKESYDEITTPDEDESEEELEI